MKNLGIFIDKARNTPQVILDRKNSYFSLSGVSYPEDAEIFYEPIIRLTQNYIADNNWPKNIVTIEIDLEYFNTATGRMLYKIFSIFSDAVKTHGIDVNILWNYEYDDIDMIETGQDFELMFKVVNFYYKKKNIAV